MTKRTRNSKPRMSLEERFWSHVDKSQGECWIWTGTRRRGYGQIRDSGRNGRMVQAHRVSLRIHGIDDSTASVVMHTCDNPPCVNPSHLRLAGVQENSSDMASKGRGTPPSPGRFYGVHRDKLATKNPFLAHVRFQNRLIHLGCFPSEATAAFVADGVKRVLCEAVRRGELE